MSTQKTPRTAATVNQIFDRYERECLDELVSKNDKDFRRHVVHLRAHFGPHDAATAELRTYAKCLDIRKGRTGRARRRDMLSASFTIAVRRWFSIKTTFFREVDRD